MGEYAREHILAHHGVDIGDDEPKPPKSRIVHFCHCGKAFKTPQAREQHKRDAHSATTNARHP